MCNGVELISPKRLSELLYAEQVAKAVCDLDFGSSIQLPWGIESFPKLEVAVEEYKGFKNQLGK